MTFTVAHKSASNKIRRARGGKRKKAPRDEGGGGGGRKGDRKRNRGMNLFMDDAGSCGGGRASGGINAKLAIHTKSAWVQVKRGEYISPGINLFELGLHWNNWTLQRSMISECSCGRKRKGGREGEKQVDISTIRRRVEDPRRGIERRQEGTAKLKKAGGGGRQERRRAESEEKCPRDDEYRRRRVSRDVQVQSRAKLMQRHAADILESPQIYSGACDAATMERIHCFYSASRVRMHMRLVALRPLSLLSPSRENPESSARLVARIFGTTRRERQFARTADNISGRTRGKRARGPKGHSEISGTARGSPSLRRPRFAFEGVS